MRPIKKNYPIPFSVDGVNYTYYPDKKAYSARTEIKGEELRFINADLVEIALTIYARREGIEDDINEVFPVELFNRRFTDLVNVIDASCLPFVVQDRDEIERIENAHYDLWLRLFSVELVQSPELTEKEQDDLTDGLAQYNEEDPEFKWALTGTDPKEIIKAYSETKSILDVRSVVCPWEINHEEEEKD